MSGKEDKTIKILVAQVEDAQKKGNIHEAYEFEMLLVEMLIYKVQINTCIYYFLLHWLSKKKSSDGLIVVLF